MNEKNQTNNLVKEIEAYSYIKEVNNADKGVCVLLNFYMPSNE